MSNLTQFAPFAGGGLKSFQTGYAANNNATTGTGEDTKYVDVTISSVNTAKAIPAAYGSGIRSGYAYIATYYFSGARIAIILPRLTSGTNLRLSCMFNAGDEYAEGTGIASRWQVAEAN